jgi:hypothetical protein
MLTAFYSKMLGLNVLNFQIVMPTKNLEERVKVWEKKPNS